MWINKNTVSLHYPLEMGTGNHSLRSRTRKHKVQGKESFKYKDNKALSTRTEDFKYKEQEEKKL